MIDKVEQSVVVCDSCGRTFLRRATDPRDVLAQARELGWECPNVNAKDRYGDTCPRCAHPEAYAEVTLRRTGKRAVSGTTLVPPPTAGEYRQILERVLREESAPGFTAGEEIARVLVAGALSGDTRMIRLVFEIMDRTDDNGLDKKDGAATAAA